MKKILLLLIVCGLAFDLTAQQTPAFISDSLNNYIARGLKDWKIPGMSVCIVKDGKVVLSRGYGVTDITTNEKVDSNTLFMIGSNTKAFTATAMAMLDDQKKLSLDDKVIKWLPQFKMYDPWVTKEVTIRDLLCHRLGFETFQGDFMYFDSDLSTAEVLSRIGKVKPVYSFRSKWGYCNAAFMTAGEIIPKVTGKSWSQYLHDNIFVPLGMNRTTATVASLLQASNKAVAHTMIDKKITKVPYGKLDNLAPAGAIASSAVDMSKWVMMQLNRGKLDGKEIMDAGIISETRVPQSILGNGGHPYNPSHFLLYGLGWLLQEYNGTSIVSHTGGVNGFVSSVSLLPEQNLAVVVLTNTDGNGFFEALKWEIVDAYLKLPYRDYSGKDLASQQASEKENEEEAAKRNLIIDSHPKTSLPLASYAGNYVHSAYGNMTITNESNKLVARFEHHKGLEAELKPLGSNNFWAVFNKTLYGEKEWPFKVVNNKVKSVTVTVASFVEFTPYEFIKSPK